MQNPVKKNKKKHEYAEKRKQKNLTRFKQNILRCKKKMEKKICMILLKE